MSVDDSANISIDLRKKFNLEVINIVEFCSSLFKDIKIYNVKMIRINVTDNANDASKVRKPVTGVLPVVSITEYLSFDKDYFSLSSVDKRRQIVDILVSGISNICTEMNWDDQIFLDRFKMLRTNETAFIKLINREKKNSEDKSFSGKIIMEIFPERRDVFLSLRNKNDIVNVPVISLNNYNLSTCLLYQKIIKDGKWCDALSFETYNDSKEIFFMINMSTLEVKHRFSPNVASSADYISDLFTAATCLNHECIDKLLS